MWDCGIKTSLQGKRFSKNGCDMISYNISLAYVLPEILLTVTVSNNSAREIAKKLINKAFSKSNKCIQVSQWDFRKNSKVSKV